jgi:hypothetical protein
MKKQKKVIQDKNVRSEEELKEIDIADFRASFCPYGYMDIKIACEVVREAGHTVEELINDIEQFSDECQTKIADIDPVYMAYRIVFEEARRQIEELTGKDICNDVKSGIEIAGNFMCTQFDYTNEAKEEFLQIIAEIPEEDRSKELKFIISEIA